MTKWPLAVHSFLSRAAGEEAFNLPEWWAAGYAAREALWRGLFLVIFPGWKVQLEHKPGWLVRQDQDRARGRHNRGGTARPQPLCCCAFMRSAICRARNSPERPLQLLTRDRVPKVGVGRSSLCPKTHWISASHRLLHPSLSPLAPTLLPPPPPPAPSPWHPSLPPLPPPSPLPLLSLLPLLSDCQSPVKRRGLGPTH